MSLSLQVHSVVVNGMCSIRGMDRFATLDRFKAVMTVYGELSV